MKKPYDVSEQTIVEIATVLFPKHKYKKAARTAVECLLFHGSAGTSIDIVTLQKFVDFMVENGYN